MFDPTAADALPARPCNCEEPFGDPRDHTCVRCGRQVHGIPLPSSGRRSEPSPLRRLERPPRARPRRTLNYGLD